LMGLGVQVVKIYVCLETDLPISKKHVIVLLAIGIFPICPVFRFCSFPFIMFGPCFRIGTIRFILGKFIKLHISGMISGYIPEGPSSGFMMLLPIAICQVQFRQNFIFSQSLVTKRR